MNKDIDMESLKKGYKENKRLKTIYDDRVYEIESNLGSEINYSKDFTDNHRYLWLRTKLIKRVILK